VLDDTKVPNPDRVMIRNARDRSLCGLGVPKLFWEPQLKDLKFKPVKLGAKQLSVTGQLQWLEWLLKEPARNPPIVVASSSPTDNGALMLAYYLALTQCLPQKREKNTKPRNLAVVNAALGLPSGPKPHPHTMIIHNLLKEATDERVQVARDLLYWFPYSCRIVVLAGEPDPYRWSLQRLRRHPTVVFHVQDLEAVT
jgi:hypothetical protein